MTALCDYSGGPMKRTFALLLAALTLAACSEPVDPPLNPRSLAPSLDEASASADILGAWDPASAELAVADAATSSASAAADPSATASGRTVVVPTAYTDMMGEANNCIPHSTCISPSWRYQQVFLGAELGGLSRITELCLRRDQFAPGQAGTQQLTVKLGPTQLDHTTITPVFDANYSAPPTTVFSGDVTLPQSMGGGTPDDFHICINFTTAYRHPAGSNLIVEILNTSGTNVIVHFADACFSLACTTSRVFAPSATAPVATFTSRNFGLVVRLRQGDPTTKDDCKDGGWEDFGFRNQGQCVRFVETGQDSRQDSA
jgi:hypothetical protein